MRAITNPSFLILHHRPSAASAVFRSLRHRLPFFTPSVIKVKGQSTSASYAELDNARAGRSGSLASPPSHSDVTQKIDVNPPKGTRDFPPEEMRLRNWLFQNFREVKFWVYWLLIPSYVMECNEQHLMSYLLFGRVWSYFYWNCVQRQSFERLYRDCKRLNSGIRASGVAPCCLVANFVL